MNQNDMSRYDNLLNKNSRFLWNPFTQMDQYLTDDPIIIASGDGVTLKDVNGKVYFDGNSSLWLNVHGHNNSELNQAIKDQLDTVAHSTLLGMANVPAIALAEELVQISPSGLDKVFYSDSGATAVEIGVKMALAYWKRIGKPSKQRFLSFENGYHGDTVAAMSIGGIDLYREEFGPLLFETIHTPFPYTYRFAGTAQECESYCLEKLETILDNYSSEIAAFVLEPLVQGAGGMRMMPKGFLSKITKTAKEHGVLVIADEVATGFGRTGELFAVDHEKVLPDIMAIGKGLTGGYLPLAATLVSNRIYEAFLGKPEEQKAFYHGHSFTGNQLGCAVSIKSLELIRKNHLIETVQDNSDYLSTLLSPLAEADHVGEIRQKGFMVGIEIVKDKATKTPFPKEDLIGYKICLRCRDLGLITRPLGDVVVFMPPLVSKRGDLEKMTAILSQAIEQTSYL